MLYLQWDVAVASYRGCHPLFVQGVSLEALEPQRILFGFFPTYRASPLQPAWDRILQVPLMMMHNLENPSGTPCAQPSDVTRGCWCNEQFCNTSSGAAGSKTLRPCM